MFPSDTGFLVDCVRCPTLPSQRCGRVSCTDPRRERSRASVGSEVQRGGVSCKKERDDTALNIWPAAGQCKIGTLRERTALYRKSLGI